MGKKGKEDSCIVQINRLRHNSDNAHSLKGLEFFPLQVQS